MDAPVFISIAAVAVSLTTAFLNYLSSKTASRRLLELEDQKHNSGVKTFRYSQIFQALQEISTTATPDYSAALGSDETAQKVMISGATERYSSIKARFQVIEPLLDKEFSHNAITAIERAEHLSNELVDALATRNGSTETFHQLMQARQNAEITIQAAFSAQVRQLTRNEKKA